jgi:hypothetical protein
MRYKAAAETSYLALDIGVDCSEDGTFTFIEYCRKLPPSGPIQNLVNITMACAMVSCERRRRIPAICVNLAPRKIADASKSAGTPSSWELDEDNCSGLASGFANEDSSIFVSAIMRDFVVVGVGYVEVGCGISEVQAGN